MKNLIFLFALLFITLSACKKDNCIPNEEAAVYMPLSIGNYWVYENI